MSPDKHPLRLTLLALLPLILLGALWYWHDASDPLGELGEFLGEHPLQAPLLFILAYALAITLFFPGVLFCLLGGALFGPWLGTVVNLSGATLGAALSFLISRHLAAGLVEQHLNATLQQMKRGVEAEGWRFVAFVRLIAAPYNLANYTFGLCRIPLGQFAAATALSLLPRLAVYAYIGHRGRRVLSEGEHQLLQLVTLAMLLVAVLLLPYLYRRLRRPLGE